MGASVVRLGDICTGHGCFPPRANSSGSGNVFVNNKNAHRVGDSWLPHACPNVPPHGGSQASGSSSVFVNNKALARVGDSISCGSSNASGSGNVFAG